MKVSEIFTSNYLKADDLKNKRVKITIDSVVMEEIGDDNKPVVYFKEKKKGLVLNKTNAAMIEEIAATEEMNDWAGVQVVLYPTRVDFQGKRVQAIRVDYPIGDKSDAAPETAEEEVAR